MTKQINLFEKKESLIDNSMKVNIVNASSKLYSKLGSCKIVVISKDSMTKTVKSFFNRYYASMQDGVNLVFYNSSTEAQKAYKYLFSLVMGVVKDNNLRMIIIHHEDRKEVILIYRNYKELYNGK